MLTEVTGKLWKISIYTPSIGDYYVKAVVGSIIAIPMFSDVCGLTTYHFLIYCHAHSPPFLLFLSLFPNPISLPQEHIRRRNVRALGTSVWPEKSGEHYGWGKEFLGWPNQTHQVPSLHSSPSMFCKDSDASGRNKPWLSSPSGGKTPTEQEQPFWVS